MKPETLLGGLCFPEGPRWHRGRLVFSDMHDHVVHAVDPDGKDEILLDLGERQPSGLGWLPDGRMLVVSMVDRRLLRLDSEGLVEHADLSGLATFHCNDMVSDAQGRCYVGNFGFDLEARATPVPAVLVRVDPDGSARVAASDLMFPNGAVITPDGHTLVVGETFASRLTAFDVDPDGTLSKRRVWAQLEGAVPDGICLDAEGQIWVASPTSGEVLRVAEGGGVSARVAVQTQAFACMLGGAAGRTLFICTAESSGTDETKQARAGRIEFVEVDVPRAGLP
jgi:sugar lactone lactonase YvrE